jgi:hypothetical protein
MDRSQPHGGSPLIGRRVRRAREPVLLAASFIRVPNENWPISRTQAPAEKDEHQIMSPV